MSELDITFIGTGNAFAADARCWNGFVVDGRYLFETPPSALMALQKVKLDPNAIDAIILSHHHGDHFLGLPFIMLHWLFLGRTRPVTIVGPPDTERLATQIGDIVFPGVFDLPFEIEWVVAKPGAKLRVGDLQIEAVEVQHDTRLIQSLGFAAELHGRRFGYTGDSSLCDAVYDLARHSEVLISECASMAQSIPVHMNLRDDMPKLRAAMPPDAKLLITHLGPGTTKPADVDLIVTADFERYLL